MRLKIKGISFSYGSRTILRDVSLEVGDGEVVSLVGPNGSGKTTLLRCINGILRPKMGVILLMGKDAGKLDAREIAKLMGYVPQSSPHTPPLTVLDTVLLGRKPYINWRVGERDKNIAMDVIRAMGLEGIAERMFGELSGGERQKVLIARALAQEPDVLLLDEPTSNLDLRHQLEVMELILSLAKEKRIAVIMAIHDLNLASRFSEKMILLKDGEIFKAGRPEDVLTPENIEEVYGVRARVINGDGGRPYIIPETYSKTPSSIRLTNSSSDIPRS